METLAIVIASVGVILLAAVLMYMFVWAARKDGEEDLAIQRKLGIRRKTRFGQ